MRETAFRSSDHRDQVPSGAYILASGGAMNDLLDRLQNGDPTIGWEGDPRLCLAYNRETTRWELWRCEHDNEYRAVGISKPGCSFPPDLIQNLMSVDGRRGYDMVAEIGRVNEMERTLRDYQATQTFRPKAEKLAWALKKDLG